MDSDLNIWNKTTQGWQPPKPSGGSCFIWLHAMEATTTVTTVYDPKGDQNGFLLQLIPEYHIIYSKCI